MLRYKIGDGYRISNGVDVRIGGLHVFVYHNASLHAKLQPCFLCQSGFRQNAYRENSHIHLYGFLAAQEDPEPIRRFFKSRYILLQQQLYAVCPHMCV